MAMKAEFGNAGIAHKHNRVTFPTFTYLNHTYKKLPKGYAVGMIAEIEDTGMKAVLCKNSSAAVAKWEIVESAATFIEDVDLPAAVSRGEKDVSVATTLSATQLPENKLNGGYLWIVGGTGLAEDGAGNDTGFRKLLLAGNDEGDGTGPIDFKLAAPCPVALDLTTDIVIEESMYVDAVRGSGTLANKALGATVLPVPADEYFWAVFYGDMPLKAGGSVRGSQISKTADGAVAAISISGSYTADKVNTALQVERMGHVKFSGTQDIVTLDIKGIDLQNTQAVATP